MYKIISTRKYRKSVKKVKHSGRKKDIHNLEQTIKLLAEGKKLPAQYQDHSLQGKLSGLRECHVSNDFLLVYEIDKMAEEIILADVGSHSELFG